VVERERRSVSCVNTHVMLLMLYSKSLISEKSTDNVLCCFRASVNTELHCIRVTKYKTAKPLLYTVYRTRNQKQVGRK